MTEDDDTKQEYRSNGTHTNVRIHNPIHARLSEHNRDCETLAGTIGRALDALRAEDAIIASITHALETGEEAPAVLLRRAERMADDPDSALEYGDVLTVVANNKSREWIEDRIVDGEAVFEEGEADE